MEYIWIFFVLVYSISLIMCYLIGSIPFGLILTKIFTKQDIRDIGSGNTGATNVLRTGNKLLAALTLALDAGKGAVPIIIMNLVFPSLFFIALTIIMGLAAIIGHCFPIWLKFKGGKGVATALGVLLAAAPYAGLAACGAWLLSFLIFRISSLAALIAIAIAPIVTYLIYGGAPAVICTIITALVWLRHKENIKRLIAGTEPKIGGKKTDVV